MTRELKQATSILLIGLMLFGPASVAWGRGGGGGGGRGGGGGGARMGGGGGMARPAARPSPSMGRSPSMSRPPSMASRPAARPSLPTTGARPATRPSPGLTPGSRPGSVNFPTAGTRPATPGLTPGSRPGVGTLPSNPRPGVGTPGVGTRPGVGAPGVRPGTGAPGISQLPAGRPGGSTAMLPGLGNRPNAGQRPSQLPNRTPQQRRDDLQSRLSNRDQIADRDNIREDWHDRYDNFYDRHDGWHHGCWDGNEGWWGHMWSDHTALMAWGTTMWGLNRLAYGFGYWGYDNPYYSESSSYPVDYSQPLPEEVPAEQPAGAPVPGMSDFDAARAAFYKGDYPGALAATDKALAAMPGDPIVHEFRALILFALGKYPESAAGLYSVLSVGPGWDWTTLSSLYANVDVYTKQLRALEAYVKANPDAADARFVLAYHYMTGGNKDAAAAQYKKLYEKTPQDTVIKELLLLTGGAEAIGAPTTPPAPAAPAAPAINAADLVGKWTAANQSGAKFALELTPDGNFTWTYSQDGKSQAVKGVYALDGNTLAMEPESGGAMLAEITQPQGGSFSFAVLGAPPGDPGLKFAKAQ